MPELKERPRLDYIDAAKSISIIMIMMGHVTGIGNPLDTWMSSLKICIFYVISGFLMAHTNGLQKRSGLQFTANLFRTLLWPYIVFSALAIPVKAYFEYWSEDYDTALATEVAQQSFRDAIFFRGINSMWFIPTLLLAELIIMLLFHMPRILRAICGVLYGCTALRSLEVAAKITEKINESGLDELHIEMYTDFVRAASKGIYAGWFLGFGYLVYLLLRKSSLLEGHSIIKFLAGAGLTAANVHLSQQNSGIDFNNLIIGDRPELFIFGGTAGSLGMILLLDAISQHISLKSFGYWGRNALIIMCTHVPFKFLAMAKNGWEEIAVVPEEPVGEYLKHCGFILLYLMFMMCGVIELINNHLPWMTKFPQLRKQKPSE